MNRSILARLHKLETGTGLDDSVQNMTDAELFSTFLGLLERAGGAETFAASLREAGEKCLAESVLQCATCTTSAEFMAIELLFYGR
jgi:hypothetical protein